MELAPQLVEKLIFGFGDQRRRTQDSPVLPDVWAYFATPSADEVKRDPLVARPKGYKKKGKGEDEPLELLLTPHFDAGPATLAQELRERLALAEEGTTKTKARKSRNIAYTQSYVAARLYFDEVATVLLPLTPWWRTYVWKGMFRDADSDEKEDRKLADLLQILDPRELAEILESWGRTQVPETCDRRDLRGEKYWHRSTLTVPGFEDGFPVEDDLLWILRIIGTIQWARGLDEKQAEQLNVLAKPDDEGNVRVGFLPSTDGQTVDYEPIVQAALGLLLNNLPVVQSIQPSLWQINRNRPATSAVWESRRAIKADAAIHLFDIKCDELAWAVLDSGIDAQHPAFLLDEDPKKSQRGRKKKEEKQGEEAEKKDPWHKRTRVKKTYDFTRLRPLLDQEVVREIFNAEDVLKPDLDEDLLARLEPILDLLHREEIGEKAKAKNAGEEWVREEGRLRMQLQELQKRLETGREVDWGMLDPLLEVPHQKKVEEGEDPYRYPVPTSSHGTHVAGILAGRWEKEDFAGICPDIWLYDLRVLDPHGPNDEFTVLAALQFVQYLNLQKEILTIQGSNLSLSIRHDVSTYACGRTPVCEECERLVATGVVVVAAGGNAGFDEGLAEAAAGAGYRAISITDPGNAEAVITVGATHRNQPHTYGVSFFSSRGPTGDGRSKPDLVAPGEKVTSTIPGERLKREDGTSMAAPHVSGAAALLMARHQELIGRPQRVKEILCTTATDLGRERHFQGAGMLDVLRALQSV